MKKLLIRMMDGMKEAIQIRWFKRQFMKRVSFFFSCFFSFIYHYFFLIFDKLKREGIVKRPKRAAFQQRSVRLNVFEIIIPPLNILAFENNNSSSPVPFRLLQIRQYFISIAINCIRSYISVNQFILIDLVDLNSFVIQWGTVVDSWKAVVVVYSSLKRKSLLSVSSNGQCCSQESKSRIVKPEIHNKYLLNILLNGLYLKH